MSLNIKNSEVERLVNEIAHMTGESKTEAVRKALEERRTRLAFRVVNRETRFRMYLENELWTVVPKDAMGKRLSREEEDIILGYGPEGV